MGATLNQLRRQAENLPCDRSQVVHVFSDGWTIRHLQTRGDEHREGELMRHCWSHIDKTDPDGQGHPDRFVSSCYRPEGIPDDLARYFSEPLASDNPSEDRSTCFSLRDPQNIPRASFYLENDERWRAGNRTVLGLKIHGVHGHGNTDPRQAYADRIKRWGRTLPGRVLYDTWHNGVEILKSK